MDAFITAFPTGNFDDLRVFKSETKSISGHYFKRDTYKELRKYENINKDCIYFLLHTDKYGVRNMYIGQSTHGLGRINNHNATKAGWTKGMLFNSMNGSWNQAIIEYLEYHYVKRFKNTKYKLTNGNTPSKTELNIYDQVKVNSCIEMIDIFLQNNGIVAKKSKSKSAKGTKHTQQKNVQKQQKVNEAKKGQKRIHQVKKFNAKLAYIGPETKDYLLLARSEIQYPTESARTWTGYYENWYDDQLERVEALLENGSVKKVGKKLILQKDLRMTASAAAAYVSGTNRSGPKFWKISN